MSAATEPYSRQTKVKEGRSITSKPLLTTMDQQSSATQQDKKSERRIGTIQERQEPTEDRATKHSHETHRARHRGRTETAHPERAENSHHIIRQSDRAHTHSPLQRHMSSQMVPPSQHPYHHRRILDSTVQSHVHASPTAAGQSNYYIVPNPWFVNNHALRSDHRDRHYNQWTGPSHVTSDPHHYRPENQHYVRPGDFMTSGCYSQAVAEDEWGPPYRAHDPFSSKSRSKIKNVKESERGTSMVSGSQRERSTRSTQTVPSSSGRRLHETSTVGRHPRFSPSVPASPSLSGERLAGSKQPRHRVRRVPNSLWRQGMDVMTRRLRSFASHLSPNRKAADGPFGRQPHVGERAVRDSLELY